MTIEYAPVATTQSTYLDLGDMKVILYACSECAAIVADVGQDRHRTWHENERRRKVSDCAMSEDPDPLDVANVPTEADLASELIRSRNLRDQGYAIEPEAVIAARLAGFKWQRIGELLGRNRASVWEKYHHDHRLSKEEQARD